MKYRCNLYSHILYGVAMIFILPSYYKMYTLASDLFREKITNTYLRLEICVVFGDFKPLNTYDDFYICTSKSLKSAFKPVFQYTITIRICVYR